MARYELDTELDPKWVEQILYSAVRTKINGKARKLAQDELISTHSGEYDRLVEDYKEVLFRDVISLRELQPSPQNGNTVALQQK